MLLLGVVGGSLFLAASVVGGGHTWGTPKGRTLAAPWPHTPRRAFAVVMAIKPLAASEAISPTIESYKPDLNKSPGQVRADRGQLPGAGGRRRGCGAFASLGAGQDQSPPKDAPTGPPEAKSSCREGASGRVCRKGRGAGNRAHALISGRLSIDSRGRP